MEKKKQARRDRRNAVHQETEESPKAKKAEDKAEKKTSEIKTRKSSLKVESPKGAKDKKAVSPRGGKDKKQVESPKTDSKVSKGTQ